LGFGERGVGGSKCGATAATSVVFTDKSSGKSKLVCANIGDARILLVKKDNKGWSATQTTVDHVPDAESERARIERFNPNPKMPLVRFVAGTWRVGGLLALSRAMLRRKGVEGEGATTSKWPTYSALPETLRVIRWPRLYWMLPFRWDQLMTYLSLF
jgi:hypothetical protein